MDVFLETERLVLRRFTAADVDARPPPQRPDDVELGYRLRWAAWGYRDVEYTLTRAEWELAESTALLGATVDGQKQWSER